MCFINKVLATSRITNLKGDAWRLGGCGMFQMGDNEDMTGTVEAETGIRRWI